jgi:peptide chain release factor 1
MTVLRARILKLRQEEQELAASAQRKAQVGGGGRSEKIRTYNFKENRVTDHRIGLTLYRLQDILGGNLAEVSDALIQDERTRQLAAGEA